MALEHDYFGLIGDYWSERIEYADQDVEVVLDADEDYVSLPALNTAAALIGKLEQIDEHLRDVFISQLNSGSSATSKFLAEVLEGESAEVAIDAITRESGDRQLDAIRSLRLMRVDIRPDADDNGDEFAEFEYALAPEDLDQRLVVAIDIARDIVSLRFEA